MWAVVLQHLAAQSGGIPNDSSTLWTGIAGNGILASVSALIYREYREEKKARDEQTKQMIEQIIPLLTRATEALERVTLRQTIQDELDPPPPRRRSRTT